MIDKNSNNSVNKIKIKYILVRYPRRELHFFFFFGFLGLHLWHMEVHKLGVESELQLPAYATAIATPNMSRNYYLYHGSWHRWIPNPLTKVKD